MKYFEVTYPYYAMIKADNKMNATAVYNKLVADVDEGTDLVEIERDYAITKFTKAMGEDITPINPGEHYKKLRENEQELLLIDSALI